MEQLKLIDVRPPPRPKYNTEKLLERTVEKLLDILYEKYASALGGGEREDVKEELLDAISESGSFPTIILSTRYDWWFKDDAISMGLKETIDNYANILNKIFQEDFEKWMIDNAIKPKHKIGDVVNGEKILEVNMKMAAYLTTHKLVNFEDLDSYEY